MATQLRPDVWEMLHGRWKPSGCLLEEPDAAGNAGGGGLGPYVGLGAPLLFVGFTARRMLQFVTMVGIKKIRISYIRIYFI